MIASKMLGKNAKRTLFAITAGCLAIPLFSATPALAKQELYPGNTQLLPFSCPLDPAEAGYSDSAVKHNTSSSYVQFDSDFLFPNKDAYFAVCGTDDDAGVFADERAKLDSIRLLPGQSSYIRQNVFEYGFPQARLKVWRPGGTDWITHVYSGDWRADSQ